MILHVSVGRGRPPKVYGAEVEALEGLDSPPKAKRKSRPPRRHKPHYDPRDETQQENDNSEAGSSTGGLQGTSNSLLDLTGMYFVG